MADGYTKITHDAEAEEIALKRVVAATGAAVSGYETIVVSLADLHALGLTNKEFKIRLFQFKDADTCTTMKMAILCTEPEAA
jgi:hypothetical protein